MNAYEGLRRLLVVFAWLGWALVTIVILSAWNDIQLWVVPGFLGWGAFCYGSFRAADWILKGFFAQK